MSASTISGQDALFAIAEETGEIRSEYISTVTSTTVYVVHGISMGQTKTFKYGLARVLGKGIRQITAYNDAAQTITVASAFDASVSAGEQMDVAWWDGDKHRKAFTAVNEAIRISYPFWYRESIVDAAAGTITLATGTNVYALDATTDGLLFIGIQTASTKPMKWIPAIDPQTGQVNWTIEGSPGAYSIRFPARYNRDGSFNQVYTGQVLCQWIAQREPILTAESSTGGTTQLPSEYFSSVGAEIYRRRMIGAKLDGGDERTFTPLQQLAQAELQRLGVGKHPPNILVQETQAETATGTKK